MDKELKLDYMLSIINKKHKKVLTQEVVDDLNLLVSDPDYGEEFKDAIITHTSILEGKDGWSLEQYLDAIKYYSLTAAANSQVDAYIKVFPERLQARLDRGQNKDDMRGEASRFNATGLVSRIRSNALVPLHILNQGTTQLAINTLTTLMLSGRSEVARVSAATALLKELRPPEVQQVELQLGMSDAAAEAHAKQSEQLLTIAENQQRLLKAGVSINDIQQLHIKTIDVEVEEGDE